MFGRSDAGAPRMSMVRSNLRPRVRNGERSSLFGRAFRLLSPTSIFALVMNALIAPVGGAFLSASGLVRRSSSSSCSPCGPRIDAPVRSYLRHRQVPRADRRTVQVGCDGVTWQPFMRSTGIACHQRFRRARHHLGHPQVRVRIRVTKVAKRVGPEWRMNPQPLNDLQRPLCEDGWHRHE